MGRMDKSMQMIAIMQEFGWTYGQYIETPSHVLTLITQKMRRDRKRQEIASKQN